MRRRKAQRGRSKGAKGTDMNSPSVITLGAKEVFERGHEGRSSKIAERQKNYRLCICVNALVQDLLVPPLGKD